MTFIRCLLLGGLFLVGATTLCAQDTEIIGRVEDLNGNPVPDAQVYLSETKWAITDVNGEFIITKLEHGNFEINVSKIGYESYSEALEINSDNRIQLEIILKEKIYKENPVVVTASKTKLELDKVSVPMAVVNKKEITHSGSTRLSDILGEQTGLNIVSNHGLGIQMQGFDPEYTLILIDNQPVIGRVAGTLDLMRLSIGNVHQIEIVKGPSSALWGSDALAGVINIITDKSRENFSWDTNARYGTHETYDGSSTISFRKGKVSGRVFGNLNGSSGYDLNKATIAPTVPKYDNYTLMGNVSYTPIKFMNVNVGGRFYNENQYFKDVSDISSGSRELDGHDIQQNYNITPEISLHFGNKQLLEFVNYYSRFTHNSDLTIANTGADYFAESFDQTLNKHEVKSSTFWNEDQITIVGVGMNTEGLKGEIYAEIPDNDSYFVYAQHELNLSSRLAFTAGFRYDTHKAYQSQFSPKFSGRYKVNDYLQVKASLGGGFKAPDFSQLYLNFTNPIAGYSVFGTTTVVDGIEKALNTGQIRDLYVNTDDLKPIKAEHSFSYNLGFDISSMEGFNLKVNGFRNNVTDLIEDQRIATKINGQSIFTYVNLNKIYTQGIETEVRYRPKEFDRLSFVFGYQYLEAERLITKTYDEVIDGKVISKSKDVFVPMFNRSKHTFNAKAFYSWEEKGIDAAVRLQYRGRYGYADLNVNDKIDANEYTKAYAIINTSLSKSFFQRYRLQLGINNITNYKNAEYLPSNPGMTFYAQLNIKIY